MNENESGTFEDTVLNVYLRQIFNAPISEFKQNVKHLRNYLLEIKQQPNAEQLLGLDELLLWTDSKLKKPN